METRLDIREDLLARAERHAAATGRPLRAVVEDGLRAVLPPRPAAPANGYRLPDRSVGDPAGPDPLAGLGWPELRSLIHDDRDDR